MAPWRKRAPGKGVVTLGGVNIGDTYEAAYRSEEGALGAPSLATSPISVTERCPSQHGEQLLPQRRNGSNVKRRLTTIQECGTEWFFWYIEQGVMGWDQVQRQMDLFEREILPEFQS